MKIFGLIQEYFLGYNSFFYWRNIIEIMFFFSLFYYFSLWLNKDKQKNLLPYFYVYCSLTLLAYYTQLTTISYFLLLFAPVAVMLFILVHQELLQRNFVALKNIRPAQHIQNLWPESLIRSFLVAINNNKEINCVIENKDSLMSFLYSPLVLNANIKQGLIKILQESELFDQKKMLWINTQGQLIGVNTSWKESVFQTLGQEEIKDRELWKQSALLLSSKTDALFLRVTPEKRTFDIIFNGKIIDNVKSNNALNIIRKYSESKFFIKESSIAKGELIHEANSQKNIFKQRSN